MINTNMRTVRREVRKNQREARENNRYLNYRPIKMPKTDIEKHLKNPLRKKSQNYYFGNDNMFIGYTRTFVAWVFIKSILYCSIPAFLLYMLVIIPEIATMLIMGEPMNIGAETIIIFGTALLFGMVRANKQMSYYNVQALAYKHNLNQRVDNSMTYRRNLADNELAVMESYRQKFNKVLLFPSVREMAIEEQLFQRDTSPEYRYKYSFERHNMGARSIKPNIQEIIRTANARRKAFDMSEKISEHYAAKSIADQKQHENGGKNEYDEMARKYKHRTTPAIREIIEGLQEPI